MSSMNVDMVAEPPTATVVETHAFQKPKVMTDYYLFVRERMTRVMAKALKADEKTTCHVTAAGGSAPVLTNYHQLMIDYATSLNSENLSIAECIDKVNKLWDAKTPA